MEHISLISHNNKKGVSMAELIAYVALYGVIMSLLASLVFVIIQAARKVNRQSILNRGATIMYTEILSETVALNPDTVDNVVYKDSSGAIITTVTDDNKSSINSISITFSKKYGYALADNEEHAGVKYKQGDRYPLENPQYLTYSYTKRADNIEVIRNNNTTNKGTINLDYKMTISSVDSDDIFGCIQVNKQSTSNKYVIFNGLLHFDSKTMEFNFVIPVFVANVPETTTPTTGN